jgi:hypothetical protein
MTDSLYPVIAGVPHPFFGRTGILPVLPKNKFP